MSYVNTYLQRDIRDWAQVADEMSFYNFMTVAAAYLLKWGNAEALEKGAMSDAFFETFVFSEIYKSYRNAGKEPLIFYYRDKDQKEIDLLLYQDGTIYPVEIKNLHFRGKRQ